MKRLLVLLIIVSFGLKAELTVPAIIVDAQQLLKALVHDENNNPPNIYDWKLSDTGQHMITWDPEANKWSNGVFTRKGIAVLSNDGKITHHRIDENIKPGYWTLNMYAQKSAPTYITLKPSDVTQENPHIEFNVINIIEKTVCKDDNITRQIGYKIKFPNKEPFWIDETRITSSKGSSSSYAITYERKPECVVKQERIEAEAHRLALQRQAEEDRIKKEREAIEKLKRKKEQLQEIRKASEELNKQQVEEIGRVKKELEGLWEQKVNLESMVGAQESYNYKQRLNLLKSKIDAIKYQKKMGKKINAVQSDIELLNKELEMSEKTLVKLKKSKADKNAIKRAQEVAKIRKQILQKSHFLLKSYKSEQELYASGEQIGAHIDKKGVAVTAKKTTEASFDKAKQKYLTLREKILSKIKKAQQEVGTLEKDINTTIQPSTKPDNNDTINDAVAIKKRLLERAKQLLQSYKDEEQTNNLILQKISQQKEQIAIQKAKKQARPNWRTEAEHNSKATFAAKAEDKYREDSVADTHSSGSAKRMSMDDFLREYISSANGTFRNVSYDAVRKYFANTVQPYYKIRHASIDQIVDDKKKYFHRWPTRNFQVTDYRVTDRWSDGGHNYTRVMLELDWHVSSPKRGSRSGHSTVALTLRQSENGYRITGMTNLDIERTKKNTPPRDEFAHSSNSYGDSKGHISFSDNGIRIDVEYPKYVVPGERFRLTARMSNHSRTARSGGLTLSFPDMVRLPGRVIKSNFASTQGYSYPDLIYNGAIRAKKPAEYFMVEGWHNRRWKKGRSKYFTVELRAPKSIGQLRVNVRGILWIRNKYDTRSVPSSSNIYDQQGFPVRQFKISIQYPE